MEKQIKLTIPQLKKACRKLGITHLKVYKRVIIHSSRSLTPSLEVNGEFLYSPYRPGYVYHANKMNTDLSKRRIRFWFERKWSYPSGYHSWSSNPSKKDPIPIDQVKMAYIPVQSLMAIGLQRLGGYVYRDWLVVIVSKKLTFKKPRSGQFATVRTVVKKGGLSKLVQPAYTNLTE